MRVLDLSSKKYSSYSAQHYYSPTALSCPVRERAVVIDELARSRDSDTQSDLVGCPADAHFCFHAWRSLLKISIGCGLDWTGRCVWTPDDGAQSVRPMSD